MAKKIGVDTPILIYLLQEEQKYIRKVRSIMNAIQSGKHIGVFSSIGLIEILTGPKKQGEYELATRYKDLIIHFPNLDIVGIDERIVDVASDLRARYNISTPDAIHLATAISQGAHSFITNDKTLKKIQEISVELL